MRLWRPVAALLLILPTRLLCQQKPEEVVREFFRAEDQNRWLDAARMLDLNAFERIRRTTVQGVRHMKDYPPPTVESMMRMDPKMPRAVAEYRVKEMQQQMRDFDIIAEQFARVTSVDTLAALSVEDAAARWLEAKGPEWRTELVWRHGQGLLEVNCPGLADSAARAIYMANAKEPRAVIRGATPDTGSVSYVVIDVDYPRVTRRDSADLWEGPLPRAVTLRRVQGVWKIEPAADLPDANGMGGSYSVSIGCTKPPPIDKPVSR